MTRLRVGEVVSVLVEAWNAMHPAYSLIAALPPMSDRVQHLRLSFVRLDDNHRSVSYLISANALRDPVLVDRLIEAHGEAAMRALSPAVGGVS